MANTRGLRTPRLRPRGTVPEVRRRGLSLRGSIAVTGMNPTVCQHELGERLSELRDQHGPTDEDVAEKPAISVTKLSRIETGRAPSKSPRNPRLLCGQGTRRGHQGLSTYYPISKNARRLAYKRVMCDSSANVSTKEKRDGKDNSTTW